MTLEKTDLKRIILAGKIADELGIQEVNPILKNISIPYSKITTCPKSDNCEQQLTQDTLRHVGVAFSHHGLIKYTDRNGETHLTTSCDAVKIELEKSGYTVINSDLIVDRESTETAITQARVPETRTNIFGDPQKTAQGYGLSSETLKAIDKMEQGKVLSESGYVPFNGMSYNLGQSTSQEDVILLASLNHYPVDGTLESIKSTESIEVVEAGIIANAGSIKEDFEDYAYCLYAKVPQSEIAEDPAEQ